MINLHRTQAGTISLDVYTDNEIIFLDHSDSRLQREIGIMTSLQKGDFLTTETTEITETKDNFIFLQKERYTEW